MAEKSHADSGPPTFDVRAVDGEIIHVPHLPKLGEPHHVPSASREPAPLHHETAARPASASAPAPESTSQRVADVGRAAYDFLVGDDLKTLRDPHASTLEKLGAAADLGSWLIPAGKIEELAAKAAEKVAERIAGRGAERVIESAVVVGANVLRRAHINGRELTAAEREGKFESFKDFKDFMGSPGEDKIYHHSVEKHNAVSADSRTPAGARFPDDDVHSVRRVVPVDRTVHDTLVTKQYTTRPIGELAPYGTDAAGKNLTLREALSGKPIEVHQAQGDRVLERAGIDAGAAHRESLEIFERRLLEHDRRTPPGPNAAPGAAVVLFERHDGTSVQMSSGYRQDGRILSVEADRVVQLTRGTMDRPLETATYSLAALEARAPDAAKLADALQPGKLVSIEMRADAFEVRELHQTQTGHTLGQPNFGR